MKDPLSPKQIEFVAKSTKHWNLAHGSVRSGKTVGTLFRFMQAAYECPDSQIYMVGHSSDTIYRNAVRLVFESPQMAVFKPFCSWLSGKRQLKFFDKTIQTLGAKDEGAIGVFYGLTMSLCYCDEITLYPESIIDMIDTRLSNSWSMGFASMNPSHPNHQVKKWIDKGEAGDPNYYSLHFTLDVFPLFELYNIEEEDDWVKDSVGASDVHNVRLIRTVYLMSKIAENHAGRLCLMNLNFKNLWKRMQDTQLNG